MTRALGSSVMSMLCRDISSLAALSRQRSRRSWSPASFSVRSSPTWTCWRPWFSFVIRFWVVPWGTRPGWPSHAGVMRRCSITIESGFSFNGHDVRSRIRRWWVMVRCHHAYLQSPSEQGTNALPCPSQHYSIPAASVSDRRLSPSSHPSRDERCLCPICDEQRLRPIWDERCLSSITTSILRPSYDERCFRSIQDKRCLSSITTSILRPIHDERCLRPMRDERCLSSITTSILRPIHDKRCLRPMRDERCLSSITTSILRPIHDERCLRPMRDERCLSSITTSILRPIHIERCLRSTSTTRTSSSHNNRIYLKVLGEGERGDVTNL